MPRDITLKILPFQDWQVAVHLTRSLTRNIHRLHPCNSRIRNHLFTPSHTNIYIYIHIYLLPDKSMCILSQIKKYHTHQTLSSKCRYYARPWQGRGGFYNLGSSKFTVVVIWRGFLGGLKFCRVLRQSQWTLRIFPSHRGGCCNGVGFNINRRTDRYPRKSIGWSPAWGSRTKRTFIKGG